MACRECLLAFFYSPFKISLAISLLLISLICFLLIKKKNLGINKKLSLIYLHVFTLIFPFVFYALSLSCDASFTFFFCNKAKAIFYAMLSTLIASAFGGYLITPYLLRYSNKSKEVKVNFITEFVKKYSKKLNIKAPKIYLLNIAKPMAYSISNIKSIIFISIGLIDLLSKKEIYAVLLHELGHIKNRTSFFKFSTFFIKLISPLSRFVTFFEELNGEEKKADNLVYKIQNTNKYLISAKRKINEFNKFKNNFS